MKPTKALCASAILAVAAVLASCGEIDDEAPPLDEDTGTIGLSVVVGPNATLYSATYTLTGPNAYSRSVMVSIGDTNRLATLIGSIPPGDGYVVSVSGVANDGVSMCTGMSDPFSVAAGVTTNLTLKLMCREPSQTGSVQIDGVANFCPVVDLVSASVSQADVGSTIGLSGSAHDANGPSTTLAYLWSATAGTIDNPSSANATFTCTDVGDTTIVLTVTDGDCTGTGSLTVWCRPAAPPADAGTD